MRKKLTILFLSLLMISVIASDDQSSKAWNRFYSAFAEFIGGNPDGITFMTTPYAFTNVPTTGSFQIHKLCNTIPEWSFSYTGKGDVYGGYSEFVNSLFFEINTQAYQKAVAQKAVVQNNIMSLNQCIQGLTAQWLSFQKSQAALLPQNQWSYEKWYSKIGEETCQSEKSSWQTSVSQYNDLLKASMINGYNYVFQAQSALNNPDNYMNVFDGTNIRNVSICTTTPDLQSSYTNWLNGQLNPGSFSLSSATTAKNDWKFGTDSDIDIPLNPISFTAAGDYNRIEIDTSSNEFSMTVSWNGLQQLQFSRGDWYNGAIIQGHMDGPFSSSSSIGQGHTKLWGENGMLGLIPSTAVVVFQPTIEISLSQTDYKKVKTSWSVDSTCCIFIFCFNSVNTGSSTSVTFNENSFSFKITDTSIVPKAIAIINNVNQDTKDEKLKLNLVPRPRDSSIFLDINEFRSLSDNSVQFSVSHNAITVKGDSSCFSGEIKITNVQSAVGLETIHCNDDSQFPRLREDQIRCIAGKLKSDTTSSATWNFYYVDKKKSNLAHFTTDKDGGSAHFTCRERPSDKGHHTAAVPKVPNQWLKKGCCNYNDSIKDDMVSIVEKVQKCLQ